MNKIELQKRRRVRRKYTIRKNLFGTMEKPRLSVFKSNKYIYIQAIDDESGKTIASASSIKMESKLNKDTCKKVGEEFAKKLNEQNIKQGAFDRNGFLYAGKIKALADAVRESGIKF